MKNSKKKIMTYILLLAVLLISFGLMSFNRISAQNGDIVEISVNGEVIKTFPLSVNRKYTIKGIEGENKLIIKDNSCYMDSADCPDKLCVTQGVISKSGESIICLPHMVVVTIKGEDSDEVDSVAK
ncbi:NusG domain II-containing protein [Butyrivibrio sp. VCD2006]|uniref:NusG domain II-containing protein n=1 Tax=Butyrivibrio sp. VCD2006 TaxID=1280664 RepID=UPI00040CD61A|nr:NusG domain II-containing protein [Butyrivibrio sp. VCD2006]